MPSTGGSLVTAMEPSVKYSFGMAEIFFEKVLFRLGCFIYLSVTTQMCQNFKLNVIIQLLYKAVSILNVM
jgi:hypothetical protein